jgi:hypothetical protein
VPAGVWRAPVAAIDEATNSAPTLATSPVCTAFMLFSPCDGLTSDAACFIF